MYPTLLIRFVSSDKRSPIVLVASSGEQEEQREQVSLLCKYRALF
jgi:hypothetical protein